jgi:polyhydroxyalkanoate synthesis regulator phasin
MFKDFRVAQEFFQVNKNYWIMLTEMLIGFEEQSEKMWNMLIEQGIVKQEEGRKMLEQWLTWSKKQQQPFNSQMEDNWRNIETIFAKCSKENKEGNKK